MRYKIKDKNRFISFILCLIILVLCIALALINKKEEKQLKTAIEDYAHKELIHEKTYTETKDVISESIENLIGVKTYKPIEEKKYVYYDIPLDVKVQEFIQDTANKKDFDYNIFMAMIVKESRFEQFAVGYNFYKNNKHIYDNNKIKRIKNFLIESGRDPYKKEGKWYVKDYINKKLVEINLARLNSIDLGLTQLNSEYIDDFNTRYAKLKEYKAFDLHDNIFISMSRMKGIEEMWIDKILDEYLPHSIWGSYHKGDGGYKEHVREYGYKCRYSTDAMNLMENYLPTLIKEE